MVTNQLDRKERLGLSGKKRARSGYILIAFLLFTSSCGFIETQDPSSAIATGVAQTQQAGQPLPSQGLPTQTLEPAQITPPPSCEDTAYPEGFVEQNGQLLLNDQPAVVAPHVNEDGSTSLWISLADRPDWPVYVQAEDCTWELGVEAWTAKITIVNTNEVPLLLNITPQDESLGGGAESQPQELTPYEYFNFTNIPPGVYLFSFSFNAGQPIELSCRIRFLDYSHVLFVVVPEGIAVVEENFEPQSVQDMDVRTSPLCEN